MAGSVTPVATSPWHDGERAVQQRLGHAQKMADVGARVIRDHMPEQHRAFFEAQHLLFMGSADAGGRPWVSVLAGPPGFARSPDPRRLRLSALPAGAAGSPELGAGQRIGLLGIDYASRRRNRLNGRVDTLDERGFTVTVEQSFGNCPKYIQRRSTRLPDGDGWRLEPVAPVAIDPAGGRLREVVGSADQLYIATHHLTGRDDAAHGVDVSHRGGRPGFVNLDAGGDLVFPDFAGNRFFNTLGNIESNGLAGLAFLDFRDGSLLGLTGEARVDWQADAAATFAGAERLVRFTPREAWHHPRLLPFAWTFEELSPFLEETGTWSCAS